MFSFVANRFYDVVTHVTEYAVNKIPFYIPQKPTSILLIGSTGNGKSTLGNFLLDPGPYHMYDKPSFPPARSNTPETHEVKIVTFNQTSFKVVDTPGLNESDCEDMEHMIAIVKSLNELQSISACILCVRFNTKIDMQFKATIDYYQKLLPWLFEDNFMIVITDYACDERSKMMRRRQGIDDHEVIANTVDQVGKFFNPPRTAEEIGFEVIDALPYSLKDRENSLNVRKIILERASSFQPVSVSNLKVMKTPGLKKMEERMIAKLDGKISGFKEQLVKGNPTAEPALNELQSLKLSMYDAQSDLNHVQDELHSLNMEELVTGYLWHATKKAKTLVNRFVIESNWPLIRFEIWPALEDKRVTWKFDSHFKAGDLKISGEVIGQGLNATLTLKVHRRDKYKADIESLSKKEKELEEQLKKLQAEHEHFLQQHEQPDEIKKLVAELDEYISEKNKDKFLYCSPSMTVMDMSLRNWKSLFAS